MGEKIVIAQIMGKWLGGGVESVVMNYYRHIDRNKIQFDFICDEDSTNIPYEEIENLGGRVIIVPPYQNIFSYLNELRKVLKANNYKIVHSHINTMSVFSLYAASRAKTKIRIAHSHATTNKKEKKKDFIKRVLRPFSKLFANRYVCCSELAGRWLFGDKTYDKNEVFLLNNAIKIEDFKYDEKVRKEIRKELKIPEDVKVIGHIGRFVEFKNHKFLIDVFEKVLEKDKNVMLMLAGKGELEETIKQIVKNKNLTEKVVFLGHRNDANRLYQGFDLFVLPSLYEGLPVVGVESQVSGLPVLLSEDMTRETKIISSTEFLSLEEPLDKWVDTILEKINSERKTDILEEITQNGFNIKNEACKLEGYYNNLIKKRVYHLMSTDVFSGAENVACQIINNFDNYDMRYLTKLGSNKKALEDRNIPVREIKKFSIKELLKVIKEDVPEIIHAHDPKACILAAIAKKIFNKKIKLVYHVHCNHENMRSKNLKTKSFLWASKYAEKIIWVSQSAFDLYVYKDNKKIKDKSIILYNAINVDEIKNKISKDIAEYDDFDGIYLGRLTDQKNPMRFIEIIKLAKEKYSDIKIAMVGDGDLRESVEKSIKEKGLEENIRLFGFMNNPTKVLNSSKMLIMSSKAEGTPMVCLEAIALGKPIISTPCDGIVDLVKNDENVFLSDDNKELADKIVELSQNNEKLKDMEKNNLKLSSKVNDMIKYCEVIDEIYKEC